MNDLNALNIYADGSSRQKPRRGGVGIHFVFPESFSTPDNDRTMDIQLPGYVGATNNQMELKACSLGLREAMKLKEFSSFEKIVIHTDSQYVVGNHSIARFIWAKNKWFKKTGEPVLNVDFWKELIKAIDKTGKHVDIRWVEGHATSVGNKAADRLAKASSQRPMETLSPSMIVRKKNTDGKTEKGSVQMLGQRVTIRVITSEYLKEQKIFRLRYAVISKSSAFYGKIDFIFSEKHLRPNHTFRVRLCSDGGYPRIEKLFKEVDDDKLDRGLKPLPK
jgi:ribonuclease HI